MLAQRDAIGPAHPAPIYPDRNSLFTKLAFTAAILWRSPFAAQQAALIHTRACVRDPTSCTALVSWRNAIILWWDIQMIQKLENIQEYLVE